MNFDKIYYLSDPCIDDALYADVFSKTSWKDSTLDKSFFMKILAGKQLLDRPLEFKCSKVGVPMDQIATGMLVIHLLSKRVVECFRQNQFTGWSDFPVLIYAADGQPVEGYSGLSVSGKCGPIVDSKSVLTHVPPGVGVRETVMTGLYFDEATYEGADFFVPENTSYIFVSETVKTALENIGASNVLLEPITQVINHRATLRLRKPAAGN